MTLKTVEELVDEKIKLIWLSSKIEYMYGCKVLEAKFTKKGNIYISLVLESNADVFNEMNISVQKH